MNFIHSASDGKFYSNPYSLKLAVASAISNFGSLLVTFVLSYSLLQEKGSGLLAGLVYASQWVAPLFCVSLIRRFCESKVISVALGKIQIVCAIVNFLLYFVYDKNIWLLYSVLIGRGLFEAAAKSAGYVALKRYTSTSILKTTLAYYDAMRYISAAFSAWVAFLFIETLSIGQIILIGSLSFALSAGIFFSLKRKIYTRTHTEQVSSPGLIKTLIKLYQENQTSFYYCWFLILLVSCYQAYFYVARTVLPLQILNAGAQVTSILQGLTALAFLMGAMIYGRLIAGHQRREKFEVSTLVTSSLMVATFLTTDIFLSLMLFLLFLVAFEISYAIAHANLLAMVSQQDVACVVSAKDALATSGMGAGVAIVGVFNDHFGLAVTSGIFALIPVFSLMLLRYIKNLSAKI